MIRLLSRLFIKDSENTADPAVRQAWGTLCGIMGIALNLVLFALKYIAGTISGSISVTADAFNNLSDAGSSLISLIGFRLSGKAPDPDHPFGHGRIEYISGLIVAALILVMGFDLAKTSVLRILNPEPVTFSWLSVAILCAAILVKLYMAYYNNSAGRRIASPALRATAADSLSDTAATAVVLAATLFTHFTGIEIDAWCGTAVSLFILYAGIGAARDTLKPLLGQPPEPEFIDDLKQTVKGYPAISGIHDLVVHDYGPGRCMISFHAEVPADGDILEMHDMIDNLELALQERLHCEAVVHMDPIRTGDAALRSAVTAIAGQISPDITIHDLRTVSGPTHTNVVFDVVLPAGSSLTEEALKAAFSEKLSALDSRYRTVIRIDRAYT